MDHPTVIAALRHALGLRRAAAWLLGVLPVLACAVTLVAAQPGWTSAAGAQEAAVQAAEPPLCAASVAPDADNESADRDWDRAAPAAPPPPGRALQPAAPGGAWPQVQHPPPQRPPRLLV